MGRMGLVVCSFIFGITVFVCIAVLAFLFGSDE
jgi:hypothetical protein